MSPILWQFWIDVGGTFTDCFGVRPDGVIVRHKLLSSGITKGTPAADSTSRCVVDATRKNDPPNFWQGYDLRLLDASGTCVSASRVASFDAATGSLTLERPLPTVATTRHRYELVNTQTAPIVAIRYLLGLSPTEDIPPVQVRLGTTRGTNALLTRQGARTAFITTKGHGDTLRIGYQNRPHLFELNIQKPTPLFSTVVEIDERVCAEGKVLRAADEGEIRKLLLPLLDEGIESLAICLLNAYQQPVHEQLVARVAEELGFSEISQSHEVAPLIKIVSRGDTTVVDAYLNPVLREYVVELKEALGPTSQLRLLTSAGGLVADNAFRGKDSILSGPAGGVVGFSRVGKAAGFEKTIGFDMGGTSTDVARFEGRYEFEYETEKAGVRIVAPMMAIETVAAGGGSLCAFDGVKLVVGPESAGADPGPACYGRGGPLAVTDANFFLGRILPEHFPFSLDRESVTQRLEAIAAEIESATGTRPELAELAAGFLKVANANMVNAIRSISIAKGCDPRDYALVAFGGAAPQHACAVARELGIRHVVNHPDAGILSAYGIGLADVTRHRAEGIYKVYDKNTLDNIEAIFQRLANEAEAEIRAEGVSAELIEVTRILELRYQGVESSLAVPCPADGDYAHLFAQMHQKLYVYTHDQRQLEVVSARVEVVGKSSHEVEPSKSVLPANATSLPPGIYQRVDLQPGSLIDGPSILTESVSTTVIDPGWQAEVLSDGVIVLRDLEQTNHEEVSTTADPVMLEIFNNQFAGIAEQMGITLRNTSSSVNVKERLDFSCALFTAGGDLVVNAPHIPVHLGAMSHTVRAVLKDFPDLPPGDVFVTNDPFRGGSHLPDVTVVTPVHDPETEELLFLTASRAHHAEIGGTRPGSMPPFSQNLAEEGVLIRCRKLIAAGESQFSAMRDLLSTGPYPSRNVDDNLADLSAQVAANRQGASTLLQLVERYRLDVVQAYMQHIQMAAETKMRLALKKLTDGRRSFRDHLDDGTPIEVCIEINDDAATIDFTGTGPVVPGNLNANPAIVSAAVLYVFRLLIDENIPLNEGVMAPLQIHIPPCLLNPPSAAEPVDCPAVAGGNVETSQRVVDVLLGALGLAAASQGTMNNVLFGDSSFGYYETICGGSGATATSSGTDAVHTHMTNTRMTDAEVLERRYPVRLWEFAIRQNSGGQGKNQGGNGIIRRIEFLKELELTIVSQRRAKFPSYGIAGGNPGASGENWLVRGSNRELLSSSSQQPVHPGDQLEIKTPGGGAYGERSEPYQPDA